MQQMASWATLALVVALLTGATILGQDGAILGWGSQVVVPQNALSNLVALAAGDYHTLGLKADGSIVAWGDNLDNHSDFSGQSNVPAPNADFVGIAAGGYHGLGLKSDGSIRAWGCNFNGQSTVPTPNSNFVGVAAGWYHSLGLKADGSIVGWGYNT